MPVHYPAGPWVRIIVHLSNNERPWQNDLWFKIQGAIPSGFNIATFTAALDTDYSSAWTDCLSAVCTYDGIDVYLNNGTYTVSGETPGGAAGAVSGTMLPTEDAAIVTLSAGIGTREGVGRVFIGGVPETYVTESKLSSAGVAAYSALAGFLKSTATYGGVTIVPAVWSRKANAIEAIVFTVLRPILGHRRKRRPRR